MEVDSVVIDLAFLVREREGIDVLTGTSRRCMKLKLVSFLVCLVGSRENGNQPLINSVICEIFFGVYRVV